jgi:hypothetical protein
MLAVEIAVACRSSENLRGSPPLPCQNHTFSGAFLEFCLSLVCFQSHLRLFFLCLIIFPCIFFVLLLERVSKPSRDPGDQYQRPLLGLVCLFAYFFLEFRYTRGLYKVSPCVHACCFSNSRVLIQATFCSGWGSHPLL